MYKVLSICLALSLATSEIITVKQNTAVDVTKDQAGVKKLKSGEPIELNPSRINSALHDQSRPAKKNKKPSRR